MLRFFLTLSLPLFALDQATKYWILQRFPLYPSPEQIEVIPGFFNLVRVHNTGMAFGLFNDHPHSNWIFGGIGILALTVITLVWKKGGFPDLCSRLAASLLVAGILGNFTDRILPGRGYVVDFLDFILPFWDKIDKESGGHFPSFNVADSCICVAAVLLMISAFRQPAPQKKEAEAG